MFNNKAKFLALLIGLGMGLCLESESFGQPRRRQGRGNYDFSPQKRIRPRGRQQFSAPSSRNSAAVSRRGTQSSKRRSPRINQFRASQQPRATGQGFSGVYGPQTNSSQGYIPSTGLNARSGGMLTDVQIIPQHRRPRPNPTNRRPNADVRPLPHIDFVGDQSVQETREWVDNTGTFTIAGRLVSILGNKIRIIKENGNTTTVPLRRLSRDDMQYLENIVSVHESDES